MCVGGVEELLNYKGIYAAPGSNDKFTCPLTGAHFEFKEMCRRIKKVQNKRQQ
jgi:hypothetical protein